MGESSKHKHYFVKVSLKTDRGGLGISIIMSMNKYNFWFKNVFIRNQYGNGYNMHFHLLKIQIEISEISE